MKGYGFTYNGQHSDTFHITAEKTIHYLMPKLNIRSLAVPKRPGEWYYRTDLGVRTIEVDIALQSDSLSDYRPDTHALAQWLDPTNGPQALVFDNEPDKTYYALLSGTGSPLTQTVLIGKGKLQFSCFDPFAYGVQQNPTIATPTQAPTAINNGGSADSWPVITVSFSATASSYKVTAPNGNYVNVTYSFASGDTLTIDCQKRKISINGNVNMPTLDVNSDFFGLVPGSNLLTLSPASVATVSVDYTERWL